METFKHAAGMLPNDTKISERIELCVAACLVLTSLLTGSAQAALGDELYKLTASDAGADDWFGYAVDISGSTAIVGAYRNDDAGNASGAAYLFDTTTGNELFKLTPSDAAANDFFGISVGISGNVAIVGALYNDAAGADAGAAYLYDTTTGNELFKLTASDAAADDRFGWSVAISGNIAIVGARLDDDAGSNSGAAYLFDATTGNELFKLTASDAAPGDFFGSYVAISGSTAIVGAKDDDDAGSNSGSAYVFDTTTGNQQFKLTADDGAAGDNFGWNVAISNNLAIVGARNNDHTGGDAGAAYLFDTTTGNQIHKLTTADATAGDLFGIAVGISGNTAIVGALSDGAGADSGSAYLFDTITGSQLRKLTASDAAAGDEFGVSAAISGNTAIVAARSDDAAGSDSGSTYLFSADPSWPFPGDANLDGIVNGLDLSVLASHWDEIDNIWTEGDFSSDGRVNGIDLSILASNWLATAAGGGVGLGDAAAAVGLGGVPEPSSVVLLAGACALIGARRRPACHRPTDADTQR